MLAVGTTLAKPFEWLAYPAIVFGCPTLAYLTYQSTADLALASTVGTTSAGVISIAFELLIPFRDDWAALKSGRSRRNTWLNLLYVASSGISQEAIAKTVIYALLVPVVAWVASQWQGASLWPHGWPIPVQVVLLLVLSDFLQYWTHRAMHEWLPAWSLHKVHHSLEELNWSAIGRMHPMEHFVASGSRLTPLIAVGAEAEVVLVYLIFLNAQGFAVHTNIRFDTRFWNYVLYTPDHHRYHHSIVIEQSNSNYAGPLLLWDWLFGTLYLPDTDGPTELGLLHDDPMRLDVDREGNPLKLWLYQFIAPFRDWLGGGTQPQHTES